jgi:hypothetical protein
MSAADKQAHAAPQLTADSPIATARPIAVARSYHDLQRAVIDWCDRIGLTRDELDAEAGIATGHAGKLLSSKAVKKFGIVTLGRVMAAAGLVLIVAVDPESPIGAEHASGDASDRQPNYQKRHHWRRHRGSAWGRRMAALRTLKQTAGKRSEIARKAAQVRWRRRQTEANLTVPVGGTASD